MKNVCVKMMMCLVIVAMCVGQGIAKEPLQPLTIQLNWMPTVQFAGILLAKERGLYEEAGIDLTVRPWKEGVIPVEEVISGKAQVGIAEGDDLIKIRTEGKPVRAIAVQFQKSPMCLVSKKEQGVVKPEHLVGKKIGYSDPAALVMVKLILASAGFKYENVRTVEVQWDLQPLLRGEVEVRTAFLNEEPLILKEMGYEATYIPGFKYGYDFYSGAYFSTDTMIHNHPEFIQKFLDVTLQGWKESFRDPAATAKLVVGKYYPEGSVSQQTESLKVFKFLATIGIGENLIGYMERPFWQKGIDILYKFKQIDRKIAAEDVFTSEFLKAKSLEK
ncbi:ABC transporter substrate-binding protein [Desulfobacterales bacterium HSG2]|nr:ABC transporter substrate-binding protein [Desulfobacterales bacterium HSG2]